MNETSTLYTVKEIQHILKVSRQTAYNLCTSGAIKTLRVGTRIRITRDALDEYLNQSGADNGQ